MSCHKCGLQNLYILSCHKCGLQNLNIPTDKSDDKNKTCQNMLFGVTFILHSFYFKRKICTDILFNEKLVTIK